MLQLLERKILYTTAFTFIYVEKSQHPISELSKPNTFQEKNNFPLSKSNNHRFLNSQAKQKPRSPFNKNNINLADETQYSNSNF